MDDKPVYQPSKPAVFLLACVAGLMMWVMIWIIAQAVLDLMLHIFGS